MDLMVGYTPDNSHTTFYSGLRYIWLDAKAKFEVEEPTGSFARNGQRDEDWVDPVIGVRQVFPLSKQWSATVQTDVGIGIKSKFSSIDTATFDYAVSDRFSVRAGYRYARIDMDKKNLLFDQTLGGFLLAARFSF